MVEGKRDEFRKHQRSEVGITMEELWKKNYGSSTSIGISLFLVIS